MTHKNLHKDSNHQRSHVYSPYRLDNLQDMGKLKMYWDIDAPDISICCHYIAVVLDES